MFAHRGNEAKAAGTKLAGVGYGIGMSFILAALLLLNSLGLNHFNLRSKGTGVHARAAITSALYIQAVQLTGQAKIKHTNARIVNHISVDGEYVILLQSKETPDQLTHSLPIAVSRIDYACGIAPMAVTGSIQLLVVFIILLVQIQKAALVGIAFLLFFSPLQIQVMHHFLTLRRKSMVWTDARIQLLSELLNGMKIVKLMAWELPFLERLNNIRVKEVSFVRSLMVSRAANMSAAWSLPTLG